MAVYDTSSYEDLGIDDPNKIKSSSSGKFNFNLPSIDINLGDGGQEQPAQDEENQPAQQETTPAQEQVPQEQNNINIELPQVNLPSVDIPQVDIQVPQISTDLSPVSDLTNSVIETSVNTGDAIADSTITAAEQFYDTTQNFFEPAVETVADVSSQTVETMAEVAQPIIEPVGEVASELLNSIGETAQPIVNYIDQASQPVVTAINEAIAPVAESLGEDAQYIVNSSTIRQGDGSGYGEISVGDTGYVVDTSRILDDAYASTFEGTPLEGTTGQQMYEAVTNPVEFIQDLASNTISDVANDIVQSEAGQVVSEVVNDVADTAVETISNVTGLNNSEIATIAEIAQNPVAYVENQATEQVGQAVADNIAGGNAGVAGLVTDVIRNPEHAAEAVGEYVVERVVETGLNCIVPGLGTAVVAIVNVVQNGCISQDTLIKTPNGDKLAKYLKEGDLIYGWDIKYNKLIKTIILEIHRDMSMCTLVKTKTRELLTSMHPIKGKYLGIEGWVMDRLSNFILELIKHPIFIIKHLRNNNLPLLLPRTMKSKLSTLDNRYENIKSITKDKVRRVINFTTDNQGSTFIGNGFILYGIPKSAVDDLKVVLKGVRRYE